MVGSSIEAARERIRGEMSHLVNHSRSAVFTTTRKRADAVHELGEEQTSKQDTMAAWIENAEQRLRTLEVPATVQNVVAAWKDSVKRRAEQWKRQDTPEKLLSPESRELAEGYVEESKMLRTYSQTKSPKIKEDVAELENEWKTLEAELLGAEQLSPELQKLLTCVQRLFKDIEIIKRSKQGDNLGIEDKFRLFMLNHCSKRVDSEMAKAILSVLALNVSGVGYPPPPIPSEPVNTDGKVEIPTPQGTERVEMSEKAKQAYNQFSEAAGRYGKMLQSKLKEACKDMNEKVSKAKKSNRGR